MKRKHSQHQRRATWLAFAVVALAVCTPVAHAASNDNPQTGDVLGKEEVIPGLSSYV